MKIQFYFLLFLFFGSYCYAQDVEKYLRVPWEELVEMSLTKEKPIHKWGDSVKISLEGSYYEKDSLKLLRVIKKLDKLTESTSIRFTNKEVSNLKIKFLNKYMKGDDKFKNTNLRYSIDGDSLIKSAELYYLPFEKNNIGLNQPLEIRIARILVSTPHRSPTKKIRRTSAFNPGHVFKETDSLNTQDALIIQEVYKYGFEARLEKARQQFIGLPKIINENKIFSRDRSLWWVRNPIAVMFLPILFLVILSLYLIGKMNTFLSKTTESDLLKFTLVTLLSFICLYFLIVFYYHFYHFLKIPESHRSIRIWDEEVAMSLAVVFPLLYVFRFIELKIQKSNQKIFVKTGLVFLSTGLIPFICLALIFLMNIDSLTDVQEGYYMLSKLFLILMSIALFRALIGYFIFKERSLITENETKLSKLRELKSRAELKSLQSQINPHFLYNSLNSIASLAPVDANKTQKMAYSLSDLFKYSINRKSKKMSTVKDEIDMVTSYLDIEKIRFGDRLNFKIEVGKGLENHEIPLFLVQPLVENAVKHGISQHEGEGKINLKIKRMDNQLLISVGDNGPDFPEGLVSGHGLQTVYDLLRLSYGDKASLNWTNIPEKAITITLPETL